MIQSRPPCPRTPELAPVAGKLSGVFTVTSLLTRALAITSRSLRALAVTGPLLRTLAVTGLLVCAASCGRDETGPALTPVEPEPPDTAIWVPEGLPTLQAAIDSARAGDLILVSPGIYRGDGNRDLRFHTPGIILRSERGPAATVIDCEGTPQDPHSGFLFDPSADGVIVEGFTVRNAYAPNGAGLYIVSSSPTLIDCVFAGNYATDSGGAVRCKGGSPRLIRCTLTGNGAPSGGAVFLIARSAPVFEQCIIAFSTQGEAVFVSDSGSEPSLICCDLYGNEGGDWTEAIAGQMEVDGNISADPLFCLEDEGDFRLREESPCAPSSSACGARVGALDVGCP